MGLILVRIPDAMIEVNGLFIRDIARVVDIVEPQVG